MRRTDYLREIQKFTTSQYWSTGVRITAGVMIPTLVMLKMGWLVEGMPFLWGSLFVSLTDTPGPIHHRRNGMLAAIAINTVIVFLTILIRSFPGLLLIEITLFSFVLSLLGVYGARAGAVGTLALVMMLLNFVPHHDNTHLFIETGLVAGGGLWYTALSLLLYRLRPYRLTEQAIGEYIIEIAGYVGARAALYKDNAALQEAFGKIMQEQVEVQNAGEQTRELLFKTRQFVADASPKSRSMMMIYLDSIDLFESSLLSYQNYELLHKNLKDVGLLNRFYRAILLLAAEIEHVGFRIQSGVPVKKNVDMNVLLDGLEDAIRDAEQHHHSDLSVIESLAALRGTLSNIRAMANRMQRIVLYTRLESKALAEGSSLLKTSKVASGQPLQWQTLKENFSLQSNHFRYSLRLTIAMLVGFALASFFSLSHTYWVLLTILTILKPVYALTRKRNLERLGGTFLGGFMAIALLAFVTQSSVLLVVMIISMLLAYSFLRVNYFFFVFFLTLFIILTFHFLNPMEVSSLIRERLIDTLIGSVIAWIAARYILPIWEREHVENSLAEMLKVNRHFFDKSWNMMLSGNAPSGDYLEARNQAIITLTNLSDKFQKMLDEPEQTPNAVAIHQLVIANHMLTGHIAALTPGSVDVNNDSAALSRAISLELLHAENQIRHQSTESDSLPPPMLRLSSQVLTPVSVIYSLAHDIRLISQKLQT